MHLNANAGSIISVNRHVSRVNCGQDTWPYSYCEYCYQDTVEPKSRTHGTTTAGKVKDLAVRTNGMPAAGTEHMHQVLRSSLG